MDFKIKNHSPILDIFKNVVLHSSLKLFNLILGSENKTELNIYNKLNLNYLGPLESVVPNIKTYQKLVHNEHLI